MTPLLTGHQAASQARSTIHTTIKHPPPPKTDRPAGHTTDSHSGLLPLVKAAELRPARLERSWPFFSPAAASGGHHGRAAAGEAQTHAPVLPLDYYIARCALSRLPRPSGPVWLLIRALACRIPAAISKHPRRLHHTKPQRPRNTCRPRVRPHVHLPASLAPTDAWRDRTRLLPELQGQGPLPHGKHKSLFRPRGR